MIGEKEIPSEGQFASIIQHADEVAALIRDKSRSFGKTVEAAYQHLSANMQQENDMWRVSWPDYSLFFHEMRDADMELGRQEVNTLSRRLRAMHQYKMDWMLLGGFLFHDFFHMSPIELLQISNTLESTKKKVGNNEILIHSRHKLFLDRVGARGEEMAAMLALPIEFVADAVKMEMGRPIETRTFSPVALMEKIGFLIQGRFAVDDYDLLVNPPSDVPTRRANRIVVSGDPLLQITTSEAMLCSVLYNLAKNAAKAHAEKHYEEDDQALAKTYRTGGELTNPLSIHMSMEDRGDALVFHVADEGTGLSLDGSLQRLHDTLSEQIRLYGAHVRDSEWFWNMRRVLGAQAESIIAWPDNPYALRDLTVGTIMDCQLVNAFGKSGRNLRTFTSGMGLWGVRYMTERLKGNVIMTNKFNGEALFSVTIPKSSLTH